MNKSFLIGMAVVMITLPLAIIGCKGNVEHAPQSAIKEEASLNQPVAEGFQSPEAAEPSQVVATETIPPTASLETIERPAVVIPQERDNRARALQAALKKSGYYTGTIDGNIGPRTKKAIREFQAAKGLKVDGRVGPKTWAELEKYLKQQ